MTKSALDSRRWVLPLVSLIPLLAIAYAFSLGPSPRKQLQSLYEAKSVDAKELAALSEAGAPVFDALVEDVQRPDSPHREAFITFLGEQGYKPAVPALRRLVTTPTELAPVRAAALRALKRVDPKGMRDLATRLLQENGPLGRAAAQMLAELKSGRS